MRPGSRRAMGLRAGNTSGFTKAAFGGPMAAIARRARRYATATDAADEAAKNATLEGKDGQVERGRYPHSRGKTGRNASQRRVSSARLRAAPLRWAHGVAL